jgi:zinc protease
MTTTDTNAITMRACLALSALLICPMLKLRSRGVAAGLLCALAAIAQAAVPFPQDESDLKPDPALHFGTLPNGVRYVIVANHEPVGRASLRLMINAGSFEETEQQRGLAHFLEHLAFNGSRHFPSGRLVEALQRMGMSFGQDTNASTTSDYTVYQLELPDTTPGTLSTGIDIFQDYAAYLELSPAKIDKERGIILSEKRTRDSVSARMEERLWNHLYPGTLLATRSPIGVASVIEGADHTQLADFYNTWYRPDRMTVVAVGDFDPAALEKMIADRFAGLTARAPAKEEPAIGALPKISEGEVDAFYNPDPDASATRVTLLALATTQHEPDTAANRLKYLPRNLALGMLNRRLQLLANKESAPFLSASASAGDAFEYVREAQIVATSKADQWTASLQAIDHELHRAFDGGFRPEELQELVTNAIHDLEESARNSATRRSGPLAETIVDGIERRGVLVGPADNLALMKPALEKITPEQCAAAFRNAWAVGGRHVIVAGNAKIDGDAPAAIVAAYRKGATLPFAEAPAAAHTPWAYADFGSPGQIVKREHVADLDMTLVTLANGVRLNLKKTDYDANQIGLVVRVGSGALGQPEGRTGLARFADLTFAQGGLGKHSVEDLSRLLAGRSVNVNFGVTEDAFAFNGDTNRADLLLTLQIITALITDPGYRPEALWQARRSIEQSYEAQDHSLGAPFAREVSAIITNGDPRFVWPAKSLMLSYTLDDVSAWLGPELARGPMEIAIVGDIDIEATIASVARTLGTLPERSAPRDLNQRRKLSFPAKPFEREYRVATEDSRGLATVYWPTADGMDVRRNRRFALLGAVLSDRLRIRIREQLGDTYTPSAGSLTSEVFPGYGYVTASATVDPAKGERIAAAIVEVADGLSRKGVSGDELTRIRNPVLASLRQDAHSNAYWLNVLSRAQEKPEVLDWARGRLADVEAISEGDLNSLARAYLGAGRASRVIVLPSGAQLPPRS